ncbi:MAG TPA: (2Fe-2S)-binding protein [Motiliproteus sp.]
MASDSAFKRLPAQPATAVEIWVEGQPVTARAGDSVTAALLSAGLGPTRTTPVSGAPRAAYCMMGVCFECLLEINGQPNTQGCQTPVAAGMQVRFQRGARELAEKSA